MKTEMVMIGYLVLGFLLGVLYMKISFINYLLKEIKNTIDKIKKQLGL